MEQKQILCRLCLLPTNNLSVDIHQNTSSHLNLLDLINQYIKIEIVDNEHISKLVCDTCYEKLNDFHNFALFVKRNNDIWIHTYGAITNNLKKENEEAKSVSSTSSSVKDEKEDNDNENQMHIYLKDDLIQNDQSNASKDEKYDNFSSDESDSDNMHNVEPQVILQESEDSDDSKPKTRRRKKRKVQGDKLSPFAETHNDIKIKKFYKYECDLCKDHPEILTFRSFKIHYKTKHRIAAYIKCCGKKFTRPYALVEHIDEHLMPDSLICPKCNKKLRTKQTLLLHMDKHVPVEERPLKCKYCDMRFMRNHFLQQHEKVHLTVDQLKYVCDLCGKRFPTDWRLKTHLNSTHSDAKPFVCDICAKSFKLKVQLQNHVYVHNNKEDFYKQCEICGVWLRSPRSFYVHMKDKHDESAPKSFPCDKCTHVSPTRKALYAHSVNKHGPKKHHCTYCTEAFSTSNLLKSHMIKHTGPGEPLKCPFCPKTFTFRSGYYSHKKKAHSNMIETTNTQ